MQIEEYTDVLKEVFEQYGFNHEFDEQLQSILEAHAHEVSSEAVRGALGTVLIHLREGSNDDGFVIRQVINMLTFPENWEHPDSNRVDELIEEISKEDR